MITVRVDVTKLDDKRYYKGAKGTYLDLVLIETPNGEYGDYMVKQSITKQEREAGVRLPILGNAKHMGTSRPAAPTQSAPAPARQEPAASTNEAATEEQPF